MANYKTDHGDQSARGHHTNLTPGAFGKAKVQPTFDPNITNHQRVVGNRMRKKIKAIKGR